VLAAVYRPERSGRGRLVRMKKLWPELRLEREQINSGVNAMGNGHVGRLRRATSRLQQVAPGEHSNVAAADGRASGRGPSALGR